MKSITEKQRNFIASLSAQTGAFAIDGGMQLRCKFYPRMDLDAALEGLCSSWEASKMIDLLLSVAPERPATAGWDSPATEKQVAYLEALAAKNPELEGEDFAGLTKKQASELISKFAG